MIEIDKLIQTSNQILMTVREMSKEEINPLLYRIQVVLEEVKTHLLAVASKQDRNQLKYHWSVLYRAGDILDEMSTLLKNTTPVMIQTEVDYIKQNLIFFTEHIVQTYGKNEALYIITPKFQELSDLW